MSGKQENLAVTTIGKRNESIGSRELTSKTSYYDKQSGNYGRVTNKESVTSGDYVNRGRTGCKDEHKVSYTVRVGDQRGYTEYFKQERVTRVTYDGGSSNISKGGSNTYGGGSITDGGVGGNYYGGNKAYSDDDDNADVGASRGVDDDDHHDVGGRFEDDDGCSGGDIDFYYDDDDYGVGGGDYYDSDSDDY